MHSLHRIGTLAAALLAACSHSPEPLPDSGFSLIRRAASSYADTPAGQNQRLLDQGYAHYWKGDFARAITQWEAAFLLEDGAAERSWGKYLLYYCYLATGAYQRALELASELVKTDPNQSLGYLQVGVAQLWTNHPALAVENFKRALEFSSYDPVVYFYLGLAYEKMGKNAERDRQFALAEKEYRQVLEANPTDFGANYKMASLYLYTEREPGKIRETVEAVEQSLRYETAETLAPAKEVYRHFYLPKLRGMMLHYNRDPEGSLKALFDAVSHAPSGARSELAEIYLFIGKNYGALGQVPNALTFLRQAEAVDPEGPYVTRIRKERELIGSKRKIWP